MKKNNILLFTAAVLLSITSCEMTDGLLDKTEVTDLTQARTFSDSTLTFAFLNTAYRDIAFNWEYRKYSSTHNSTTNASDDGVSPINNEGAIHPMINGTLSAAVKSPYRYEWETTYKNIRHLNVFLANVDKSPLSAPKVKRLKAEARFLRAWYYSIVLKYFGGAVLMGDMLVDPEHMFDEKRSSYAETVNYLVAELDAAAKDLPYQYSGNDFGRITTGAAAALKARILLFAASPLFNGSNIGIELGASPEQVAVAGYANYDANRWKLAQRAAFDVMDLNEYSLYQDPQAGSNPPGYSFSRVFLNRVNSEYIFQYNLPLNRELEAYFFTKSRNSGTWSMPTHNLASSFGMINGKRTNEEGSGFDKLNPFENRDPRFNYTIAFNGTLWHNGATNSKTRIYTYLGAPLDGYLPSTFHTGYFWRKMQEENTAWNGGGHTERSLPIIRYAEVLLAYAEASNEVGESNKAYDQLKVIRKRAGILPGDDGLYGLKPNMSKEEMRAVIQNEWRVEFAFEEHRFWDLRRWKIAEEVTNGLQLEAMKITLSGGKFLYEVVPVNHGNSKLVFLPRNHLFPIAQEEIDKNRNLVQNPGY